MSDLTSGDYEILGHYRVLGSVPPPATEGLASVLGMSIPELIEKLRRLADWNPPLLAMTADGSKPQQPWPQYEITPAGLRAVDDRS